MNNAFTSQQLAKMRDEYGKISTIDPSGPEYKKLISMLDKMHIDNLKSLAGAKIKFVSGLAQNRVNRAAMKKEEVNLDENEDLANARKMYHKHFVAAMKAMPSSAVQKRHQDEMEKYKKIMGNSFIDQVAPSKFAKFDKKIKEETNLQEKSAYEIYHKDYSSAVQTAIKQAEKRGFEVDMDDWHDKVATGPKKPSAGKTNSFSVNLMKDGKESKKKLHLQVYNMDNHKYELNMYIESIEEACWDTHKQVGMKKKGNRMVPDCRPKNEASSPAQQAAIAIAMKKAGKTPKDMEESDAYDKDVKPSDKPHDKEAAAKRAKLAALAARKKNIKEAEGGGTSISSTDDASTAVKRAQVLLKSTQLRLKHDKEREAMAKQKQALRKEEEDKEYPEVKTGGKPLAKKFEKAFAKMGIKTNIKMKTVANTSINEKEDKKEENGKEAPAKQKAIKKGETLSGKQEPIKIDPEIESR
jgi:hypothetical protein